MLNLLINIIKQPGTKIVAPLVHKNILGAVHILRNTGWGGLPDLLQYYMGGSPQFITILHRGGLESLLQFYSFERKMQGYNPFPALN